MPKGTNQKFKLYRLSQIMLRETDEEHGLTIGQIKEKLEEYGITADRKSLYDDMAALGELGIDIEKEQVGRSCYYHVVTKQFELPELKLLVDAIQSSKFITVKKSNSLIKKLTSLASRYEAMQLDRQVFVSGRIKTMNESIYYNVDAIYNAIAQNCRIRFEYLMWNIKKELVPRRQTDYVVSPWGLSWNDENYYLVAFDSEAGKIKHYRVDKMRKIRLLGEKRDGQEYFRRFDLAAYAKKSFGMFGGEEQSVRIRFDNQMVGVFIDRFGKEIEIYPVDESCSETIVNVAVSNQFFGWIFALGDSVKIVSPKSVVEQFDAEIAKRYVSNTFQENMAQ